MISYFFEKEQPLEPLFNKLRSILNTLLDDFELPYSPTEIFSRAEDIFKRFERREIPPRAFLTMEIQKVVRERTTFYGCIVAIVLKEIISTAEMGSDTFLRSYYCEYLNEKIRALHEGERILDRWTELKRGILPASRIRSCTKPTHPKIMDKTASSRKTSTQTMAENRQQTEIKTTSEPSDISDNCSLADLVDHVIAECSLDECCQFSNILQSFDYERKNKYSSLVRKLKARIKEQRNKSNRLLQPNTTFNISGGTVNNVGSTIERQQNEKRYGK